MFSGRKLDYSIVEQGLRELDSRFSFDMLVKKGWTHPYARIRAGIWYDENHITSIDRGVDKEGNYIGIPEFKQWESTFGWAEIDPSEAERYDMVSMPYLEVRTDASDYDDAKAKAAKGDWPFGVIRKGQPDELVVQYLHCRAWKERLGRVMYVGWRHTFENILLKVPTVDRLKLGAKFGVDLFKYPVGPPEEVMAALVEE